MTWRNCRSVKMMRKCLGEKRKRRRSKDGANLPAVPVIIIVQEQIGKSVCVANVSTFDPDNIAKQVIGDNTTAASSSTVNPNRIIIILDGVEAEIQHDQLKALQDKDIRVAAIIITTHNCCLVKNIIADSEVKPYDLKGLNKEDSLSLFQTILGPDAAHHSVNNKCRGVPQAIQIMAKLLHSRPSPLTEFTEKLKNSYYYEGLPCSCFTYCSLFPQDYEFDAEGLIHLWAAEGFLNSSNPSTSPEEIGRKYLRDLVEKSIFYDVKEDELGEIRSCTMHPLMHDIARFLLNDTENIPLDPYGGEKVHHQLRRTSFDLSLLGISDGIPASLFKKAKELKTFMFFNTGSLQVDILKNMLKSFRSLCVLDLRDAGIDNVPDSIGVMKELEYLDLSLNGMGKLPNSISKLSKLLTLKLYRCYDLKELPKNFEKLKKLKHLDMRLCVALTCMPRKMNRLASLETLSAFAVSKKDPRGSLEELAKLTQLRGYLTIFHLDRVPKPLENEKTKYLKEIQNLHSLTLRWDLRDEKGSDHKSVLDSLEPHSDLRALMLEGYGGPTLSGWLISSYGQFNDLVSLRLEDCRGCKYLSEQDRLPKIKILRLVRLQNLEYIIVHKCDKDADFYKNLEELTIKDCRNLKSWWQTEIEVKQRPFFAKISKLDVSECPKLMPPYPRLEGSTSSN